MKKFQGKYSWGYEGNISGKMLYENTPAGIRGWIPVHALAVILNGIVGTISEQIPGGLLE